MKMFRGSWGDCILVSMNLSVCFQGMNEIYEWLRPGGDLGMRVSV